MQENTAVVLGTGDLVLNMPDMDFYFDPVRETLKRGDLVIGHVEIPHTERPHVGNWEGAITPAGALKNLECLRNAGFHVATYGGNHSYDAGYYGVIDGREKMESLGLQVTGAGKDIWQAMEPARLEKKGLRFSVIECTCIGPRESWASPAKAGAAFIRVVTTYVADNAEPGSAPDCIYTTVDPGTFKRTMDLIREEKKRSDVVIASFHAGRMGPPDILQYQFEITHGAVDAGADMVLCCHAHSLRGVEVYKGTPIFHGLGNFVTVTDHFTGPLKQAFKGYEPFRWQGVNPPPWTKHYDPQGVNKVPHYPSSELSRRTLIAKGVFDRNGLVEARMIPCFVMDNAQTAPVRRGELGDKVLEHVLSLNEYEGFDTRIHWAEDGTELVIER